LNVFQFLTVVFMILLLPIYSHWFGIGFEVFLTIFFIIYAFYPNFFGWIHKLSYNEIRYQIMVILAIIWTFLLFNISRIIGYVYEEYLGIVYLVSLIPVVILILYLTHYKEWRNFHKSLTHWYFEDYMKRKAKERAKKIELELETRDSLTDVP